MSIKNVGKRLGRWGAVCALLWGGLYLAGCQTQSPEQQFAELPPGLAAASGASPVANLCGSAGHSFGDDSCCRLGHHRPGCVSSRWPSGSSDRNQRQQS